MDGSSPRLRGTVQVPGGCQWDSSVHPRACGEQALAMGDQFMPPPVHPRACGEQTHGLNRTVDIPSSRFIPAPAGNRLLMEAWSCSWSRFIPAPAGNRSGCPDPRQWPSASVHPRACGEQAHPETEHNREFRFIPAPAGNSGHRLYCGKPLAVHPRACGEQSYASFTS